jgi:hypothetical protein
MIPSKGLYVYGVRSPILSYLHPTGVMRMFVMCDLFCLVTADLCVILERSYPIFLPFFLQEASYSGV